MGQRKMSDRALVERLQPSLLDRLTDDDPSNSKETRDRRVIDLGRLRDIIQRDLSWLLNTHNSEGMIDSKRYPSVARSTLNFGLAEVAGEYSTSQKTEEIRRAIERAIRRFEPRIIDGSVDVRVSDKTDDTEMTVGLDIRADMWAQPMPLELYLRSKVDLTTGEVNVERRL